MEEAMAPKNPRTDAERRRDMCRAAIERALTPNYEAKMKEAEEKRWNKLHWNKAWNSAPYTFDTSISLAVPNEKDHQMLSMESVKCGHVDHPRVFHVILPVVFQFFENEWYKTTSLDFEPGFFNFIACYMEQAVHRYGMTTTKATGLLCPNATTLTCVKNLHSVWKAARAVYHGENGNLNTDSIKPLGLKAGSDLGDEWIAEFFLVHEAMEGDLSPDEHYVSFLTKKKYLRALCV